MTTTPATASNQELLAAHKRCTTWIKGSQCTNYRLSDTDKCAMHAKPRKERQK